MIAYVISHNGKTTAVVPDNEELAIETLLNLQCESEDWRFVYEQRRRICYVEGDNRAMVIRLEVTT